MRRGAHHATGGFLLAGELGDPQWSVDEAIEDLGDDATAFLKHYGAFERFVGYAAECKLAGITVSPVAIQTFAGLCENVIGLRDPLCLAPGENEVLGALARPYIGEVGR